MDTVGARELAHATLAGVRRAMVAVRALRDHEPLSAVRDATAGPSHLTLGRD
jgi:hypothetical protein